MSQEATRATASGSREEPCRSLTDTIGEAIREWRTDDPHEPGRRESLIGILAARGARHKGADFELDDLAQWIASRLESVDRGL